MGEGNCSDCTNGVGKLQSVGLVGWHMMPSWTDVCLIIPTVFVLNCAVRFYEDEIAKRDEKLLRLVQTWV